MAPGGRIAFPEMRIDTFESLYRLGERIGSGGFAEVHQALDRSNGEDCAVKIVDINGEKGSLSAKLLRREIDVLSTLRHPGIISLKAAYIEGKTGFIVTERCLGGDLLDELVNGRSFSEVEVRGIVRTLVRAVEHMHSRGVVHRDLKLENILLSSYEDRTKVKIADFGLAASLKVRPSGRLNSLTGSLLYVAPEVVRTRNRRGVWYDERADIWSLGVCLYILLTGRPPIDKADREEQFRAIEQGKVPYPVDWFLGVPRGAIDLVRAMLVVDPADRITIPEMLAHPWVAPAGRPSTAHAAAAWPGVSQWAAAAPGLGQSLMRRPYPKAPSASGHTAARRTHPRSSAAAPLSPPAVLAAAPVPRRASLGAEPPRLCHAAPDAGEALGLAAGVRDGSGDEPRAVAVRDSDLDSACGCSVSSWASDLPVGQLYLAPPHSSRGRGVSAQGAGGIAAEDSWPPSPGTPRGGGSPAPVTHLLMLPAEVAEGQAWGKRAGDSAPGYRGKGVLGRGDSPRIGPTVMRMKRLVSTPGRLATQDPDPEEGTW